MLVIVIVVDIDENVVVIRSRGAMKGMRGYVTDFLNFKKKAGEKITLDYMNTLIKVRIHKKII